MILDDCRAMELRKKSNGNGSLSLRTLLVTTTLLSTCFVVLAADITSGNGGIHIQDSQPNLRRGNSEADFGITALDLSPSPFRAERLPIRILKENSSDANALCDLGYCQANFDKESLCPAEEEEKGSLASIPIVAQIFLLLILLSFSALFSGLTLGLMSLDLTGLEIVMAGDDPDAAKYAATIYPLRKEGNLLLCTLLLGNVAVNSLMAIFTAAIFNGTVGFIASTMLIVIFGEIIPQALVGFVLKIFPVSCFPEDSPFGFSLLVFVIWILVFSVRSSYWECRCSNCERHQMVVPHHRLAVGKGFGPCTRERTSNDLQ